MAHPRANGQVERANGMTLDDLRNLLPYQPLLDNNGNYIPQSQSFYQADKEALVKAGADVDIKDRQGSTALAHAKQRGYADMVKILTPASGRRT